MRSHQKSQWYTKEKASQLSYQEKQKGERDKENQMSSAKVKNSSRGDSMFCVESCWQPLTKNKEIDIEKNKNILVGPQKEEKTTERGGQPRNGLNKPSFWQGQGKKPQENVCGYRAILDFFKEKGQTQWYKL